MIAQTPEERQTVVHDIKLVGSSDVAHQIDVTVEGSGERKSLLIECKDFDVSGDKVGLSIVRDFWAVVDDTGPDEAWILTCNGFTSEALKFAKAKGIKCVVMRLYTDEDDRGRIKRIFLNMHQLNREQISTSTKLDTECWSRLRKRLASVMAFTPAMTLILKCRKGAESTLTRCLPQK